jgi:uncharacterized MAPEG superfamily protein
MIIAAYPLVLLLVSVTVNLAAFGVQPLTVALPSNAAVTALAIAMALLVANHAWLMTSTELTRLRFGLSATPEERAARVGDRTGVSSLASEELERRHNAHRNATENVVCFVGPALLMAFTSPSGLAVGAWSIGFALARLGYTYSYLARRTGARGVFMSLSLLALFGIISHLAMSTAL